MSKQLWETSPGLQFVNWSMLSEITRISKVAFKKTGNIAPMILVRNGQDHVFLHWWYQTITWTNVRLLNTALQSMRPTGKSLNSISMNMQSIIIQKYNWKSCIQKHFVHDDGLSHWGLVTHICVGNLPIIASDNHGLSQGWGQTIIWTNAGMLLIGPLGTIFSEILIKFHTFSFNKMHLKILSVKRWPFCLGLNMLMWETR